MTSRFQASMPIEMRKQLDALTKQLADEGKLVEAGWIGCRLAWVPHDAPEAQVQEMRRAFMAGAQHLFASLLSSLDPGTDDEPTEADMRRMDLVAAELGAYYDEVVAGAIRTEGRA